jgi:hypothetical protein
LLPPPASRWVAVGRGALSGGLVGGVFVLLARLRFVARTGSDLESQFVDDFFAAYVFAWAVGGALIALTRETLPSRIAPHVGWALAVAVVLPTIGVMTPEGPARTFNQIAALAIVGAALGPFAGMAWRRGWNSVGPV